MSKTKIDWCDITWNPVWGCLRGCEYCYARKFAKRFYKKIALKEWKLQNNNNECRLKSLESDLKNFEITWLESNFKKNFPRKPSRIFVNSMSDISYWEYEWIDKVLNKIKEYPQHTFIFLTKCFDIYADYKFSNNCWLGYTIVNQKQMDLLCYADAFYPPETGNKFFISIEPIQEPITIKIPCDWLIIGAETGNRKNKVIPEKSWIANLLLQADKYMIPVFMKDNLKPVWRDDLIQEFPE